MNEKGIPKPPEVDKWFDSLIMTDEAWRWISRIFINYPKVETYSVTWNPDSVAANTSAEQTVTVNGLSTTDIVFINKPTTNAGLVVGGCRVSSANTLAVTFGNLTASPINPGSESYYVMAIRR